MKKLYSKSTSFFIFILILAVSLFVILGCSKGVNSQSQKTPVIYIHDGAIDEYISLMILSTMNEVDIKGVLLVDGDCIGGPAMDLEWIVQHYIERTDIPVSLSNARPLNPFPWDFRTDCIRMAEVEALSTYSDNASWPSCPSGEEMLANLLEKAIADEEPVTILCECSIAPLYYVLSEKPELEKGIDKVIWMAGAVNVEGNVAGLEMIPKGLAGEKSEWNIFWDTTSAKWVFENTEFPMVIFPLDVTDQAKITEDFLNKLQKQSEQFKYSKLAYQSYLLAQNQPYYEMWDVLTTCYLSRPDIFSTPEKLKLDIATTGPHNGAFVQTTTGREASAVLDISNTDAYYDYVLNQLRR